MAKLSSSPAANSGGNGKTSPPPGGGGGSVASSILKAVKLTVAASVLSGVAVALYVILLKAYDIRLDAIREYGLIIHEFDPYFNFRAAEYLHEHGPRAFFNWFDTLVWYPLGRPVGTTIYPGMQFTAVWLQRYVLPYLLGVTKSLNDVCCLMPAWFGSLATLLTGLLAAECAADFGGGKGSGGGDNVGGWGSFGSILDAVPIFGKVIRPIMSPIRDFAARHSGVPQRDSANVGRHRTTILHAPALFSGVVAAAFMSVVPAHLMRSVGGGFDNESVAMSAMTLVFYLWTRSLRGGHGDDADDGRTDAEKTAEVARTAALRGAIAGIAYFYMAAAWGGYVFVINVVGAHAGFLVLTGRHSSKLHASYSAFYAVGTLLATRVPVVGTTPLRSLEQLGPMVAFFGLQVVEYCERKRRTEKLSTTRVWALRCKAFTIAAIAAACLGAALLPTGYFGPISSRVRGLFVEHTKTGNPLVDSVAEHQAAAPDAFERYLTPQLAQLVLPGFAFVAACFSNDASSFLLVYGMVAYFFSLKMVRLILLTAPIACALAGVLGGRVLAWIVGGTVGFEIDGEELLRGLAAAAGMGDKGVEGKKKKEKEKVTPSTSWTSEFTFVPGGGGPKIWTRIAWLLAGYYLYIEARPQWSEFSRSCEEMAKGMSHPSILFKGQRGSEVVIIDDYRESYFWLRDNTPEDARIMAWWDYGYQITAMANRTTIADGNTWNHEHIALLGRALTSPLKDGHRIARHLADYVLLWTGGGGDDLAKSPHLARIANSVYRDMCPGDPTCSKFSMPNGMPSKMMEESLLYRLHSHKLVPGVEADKNRFKEVYKSTNGKVRIFKVLSVSKESKEWVKNNRECDAPGSWYCPGHYPPGLEKVLSKKKDFKQLEDFNAKTEDDSDYQRQYFEHLSNPEKAKRRAQGKGQKKSGGADQPPADDEEKQFSDFVFAGGGVAGKPMSKEESRKINQRWEDNKASSQFHEMIVRDDIQSMAKVLSEEPGYGHIRSKDGRGPMWWAHEHGRAGIIALLKSHGVSERLFDKDGMTPLDLSEDEF